MSLKAGIVGLPNVGKSTLFNAITKLNVEAANYPFATIEPNVGIVELKDHRIDELALIVNPQKIMYATFEFTDIAGLVKGASKGEGLGNKFLSNIREVDAIIHVVRCFENTNITHVSNRINPIEDLEIVNLELLLSDMDLITKILQRLDSKVRAGLRDAIEEKEIADKILAAFKNEKPARSVKLNDKELKLIKSYNLLTLKPMLYIANVNEEFAAKPQLNQMYNQLKEHIEKQGDKIVAISAKIEQEISELDNEDQFVFLDELGLTESGINKIIKSSFEILGLCTYFTAGPKEVRAWVFKKGSTAPECAGIIHTDFERGFIKAEVIPFQDYIDCIGEVGAKQNGKMRLEGKNYIMQDGDVCLFKFNV